MILFQWATAVDQLSQLAVPNFRIIHLAPLTFPPSFSIVHLLRCIAVPGVASPKAAPLKSWEEAIWKATTWISQRISNTKVKTFKYSRLKLTRTLGNFECEQASFFQTRRAGMSRRNHLTGWDKSNLCMLKFCFLLHLTTRSRSNKFLCLLLFLRRRTSDMHKACVWLNRSFPCHLSQSAPHPSTWKWNRSSPSTQNGTTSDYHFL